MRSETINGYVNGVMDNRKRFFDKMAKYRWLPESGNMDDVLDAMLRIILEHTHDIPWFGRGKSFNIDVREIFLEKYIERYFNDDLFEKTIDDLDTLVFGSIVRLSPGGKGIIKMTVSEFENSPKIPQR